MFIIISVETKENFSWKVDGKRLFNLSFKMMATEPNDEYIARMLKVITEMKQKEF